MVENWIVYSPNNIDLPSSGGWKNQDHFPLQMGDSLSGINVCCGDGDPHIFCGLFWWHKRYIPTSTNFKKWKDETISTIVKYHYDTIKNLLKYYSRSILLASVHKTATLGSLRDFSGQRSGPNNRYLVFISNLPCTSNMNIHNYQPLLLWTEHQILEPYPSLAILN